MPTTTHYGGFKSAGSNGNNDNRHACTIANQCNEVYYLDRHNITCPGESSVRFHGWRGQA